MSPAVAQSPMRSNATPRIGSASASRPLRVSVASSVTIDPSPSPSTVTVSSEVRNRHSEGGKPGALRHLLAGPWPRRIDDKHRLVSVMDSDDLVALKALDHDERCGGSAFSGAAAHRTGDQDQLPITWQSPSDIRPVQSKVLTRRRGPQG